MVFRVGHRLVRHTRDSLDTQRDDSPPFVHVKVQVVGTTDRHPRDPDGSDLG